MNDHVGTQGQQQAAKAAGRHIALLASNARAASVWSHCTAVDAEHRPALLRKLGGQIKTDSAGRMTGTSGLESIDFAVVSTATAKPLAGLTWDQAQDAWWETNRPHSEAAAFASLTALQHRWELANATTEK